MAMLNNQRVNERGFHMNHSVFMGILMGILG